MNLIGKIFVLIILLMSMLFMVLAMAVYSTQTNWREAYVNSQKQLNQKNLEYGRLESRLQLTESELQRQVDAVTQDIGRLQTELTEKLSQIDVMEAETTRLKQESRDATAAVSSTEANAERLANENTVLQRDIVDAQQASDQAFTKTVEATSALHDTQVKLASAEETISELTERVANMTAVMRSEGLDPHMLAGDTKPTVEGYISTVSRRGGDETIEITIGSDDGIKPEHTVEIYRTAAQPGQSKWLGRAVVLSTDGDRAYARVLRDMKKGNIQEGDRVATRLN